MPLAGLRWRIGREAVHSPEGFVWRRIPVSPRCRVGIRAARSGTFSVAVEGGHAVFDNDNGRIRNTRGLPWNRATRPNAGSYIQIRAIGSSIEEMKFSVRFCSRIEPVFGDAENFSPTKGCRSPRQLSPQPARRDRKSTRLNSSHLRLSRMPSSA